MLIDSMFATELTSSQTEALRATADYIEQTGLWHGTCWDYDRARAVLGSQTRDAYVQAGIQCCTLGGMSAFGVSYYTMIRFEASLPTKSIPTWNDAPEQTTENVVKTLRAFAAKLEAEGH
jgi:hypothetical protein